MESNFSRAQLCICGGPDVGKKLAGECISRFEFGGVRGGGGGGNGVTRFFYVFASWQFNCEIAFGNVTL